MALNERILQAEEAGSAEYLAQYLHEDFAIIRASSVKQRRKEFLDDVQSNANLGRFA